MGGCMKERKRYECLRFVSTQAHRVRTRALLVHVHLHKREKIVAWAPGCSHTWRGPWEELGVPWAWSQQKRVGSRARASLVGQWWACWEVCSGASVTPLSKEAGILWFLLLQRTSCFGQRGCHIIRLFASCLSQPIIKRVVSKVPRESQAGGGSWECPAESCARKEPGASLP